MTRGGINADKTSTADRTLDQCKTACNANVKCKNFEWDNTKNCDIWVGQPMRGDKPRRKEKTTRKCYIRKDGAM